jgi:hypothetical protein
MGEELRFINNILIISIKIIKSPILSADLLKYIYLFIYLLAEIPGVAQDSIRNKGTREINYGSCISASRPKRKSPWYSLDRRLGGPQNRSGRCGEEKHFAPAGNPTPAVQPVARRDATDTGDKNGVSSTSHLFFT